MAAGAVPAGDLAGPFPALGLAIEPPLAPMEARPAGRLPAGEGWLYEPKWDGFRCLLFRRGKRTVLQSKAGQPLGRYFPELVAAAAGLASRALVLDGEVVVLAAGSSPALDFDALLQRIHPAESRIRRLARETPATFIAFDLLLDERRKPWLPEPLARRRQRLERLASGLPRGGRFLLSPATTARAAAAAWLRTAGAGGIDGIVAKRLESPYLPGERGAMVKVKPERTADCVVGGFRWAQSEKARGQVGSLLLGLYDDRRRLDHVGFCASFSAGGRRELAPILEPLIAPPGFTGRAPGGPSRWSQGRATEWVPLRPALVCEVRYDHFSNGRFRHGTRFLRWRPDKAPEACTFDQLQRRTAPLAALPL